MSTSRRSELEIVFWIVVALCAGALLGGAIVWAASEPLPPDCSYQRTAGNWQAACVPDR